MRSGRKEKRNGQKHRSAKLLCDLFLLATFAVMKLSQSGVYTNAIASFRRVVYTVFSAHTTTGFSNVYARQFATEWGDFGILILVIAMLIGGSACSTAGGFKGLRVGIVFKGIVSDIKKYYHPKEASASKNITILRTIYWTMQPLSLLP